MTSSNFLIPPTREGTVTHCTTKRSPSNIYGTYKQLTVQKKALVSADNNVSSRVISGLFCHTFIKTFRKETAPSQT